MVKMGEWMRSMFLVFTPSVGVEQFWVDLDGVDVDAYFQCRSNMCGWSVRDLDFNHMTSL
jgi:hypothetical protein